MIELVRPTVDLADSWWAMVDAFAHEPIPGSSYRPSDREVLHDPDAFALWVDWLGQMERAGADLPEGHVPSSHRWIVEDGKVVGTIALRHGLNALLRETGGHIAYAVEPGSRRRGVARAALRLALVLAARRGIQAVLITCEDDNVASARTIEAAGGVLEDVRGGMRRYWVTTAPGAEPEGPWGGSAFAR